MNRDILISVIVPAYNVEEWISRCLDSILNQSHSNLEVIAVDDGSTDKTPQILDQYALEDRRFRVIHQSNSGLIRVHERGIAEAKGQYVGFVDGDDEIKVKAWISIHREDLFANWELLITEGKFFKIDPLR